MLKASAETQVMATDLSRLNVTFGEDLAHCMNDCPSPSAESMDTERDSCYGSPSTSDCFNPFDTRRDKDHKRSPWTGRTCAKPFNNPLTALAAKATNL